MPSAYYPASLLGPSIEDRLRARLADPYAGGGLIYARPLTMRERLGNLLGLGDTRDDVRNAEMAGRVLDLLPFSGGALAMGDAADAAQAGDMLGASLLGGSSALGAMPLIGGMARRAVGAGRRLLLDAPYSNYKIDPDLPGLLASQSAVRSTPNYVSEKIISPEDLSSSGYLLNLVGDRTGVGEITRLAGKDLSAPIVLDGGMGYMRGIGTGAWASDKNVIRSLANKVRSAEGAPVYGTYMAMSGTGSDFSNMTRAVAMRDFDPKQILKKDVKDFDRRFKAAKAYDSSLTQDFPGIASEKLDDWLDKSGTRRAAFFDFMDKAEWRDKGFPNVTNARFVIQDAKLRDIPSGVEQFGGQSLALLAPEATTRPTASLLMPHGTYSVDLAGDYLGGFSAGVPRSILFPEWYAARRSEGKAASGDNRAFQMSNVLQPTDQKWLDGVMKYLEANQPR